MEIKHSIFLYFLFFIISTYSVLIPNNRVITDSNSILNPYQHWVFKRIEDNLFDIVHVKSRNLDSDGLDVYISDPEHNSKTNPYQQWLFEPSNYNLTAVVTDFE